MLNHGQENVSEMFVIRTAAFIYTLDVLVCNRVLPTCRQVYHRCTPK